MLEPISDRLVFRVELEAAIPIRGTNRMQVILRAGSVDPLTVTLTRSEAAELMRMILAERSRARVAEAEREGGSGRDPEEP